MIVEPIQPYLIAISVVAFAVAGRNIFAATALASEQAYCPSEYTAHKIVWIYLVCAMVALVLLTSEYWLVFLA